MKKCFVCQAELTHKNSNGVIHRIDDSAHIDCLWRMARLCGEVTPYG